MIKTTTTTTRSLHLVLYSTNTETSTRASTTSIGYAVEPAGLGSPMGPTMKDTLPPMTSWRVRWSCRRVPATVEFKGTLVDESFANGTLCTHGGVRYTGEFQQNAPHGKGRMELPGGAYLEGSFFQGKLHGNGRMRLENGYVYSGSFLHGVLPQGELRTAEYTYEGQLSPQGLPQGVGRSEQLQVSPRLVFEGFWENGRVVSGTCKDEHGTPVDFLNRPDLQKAFGSDEDFMMNEYCMAKQEDGIRRANEIHSEYLSEAEQVERENRKIRQSTNDKKGATEAKDDVAASGRGVTTSSVRGTSRMDLGYEHSVRSDQAQHQVHAKRAMKQDRRVREDEIPNLSAECESHFQSLDKEALAKEGVDIHRLYKELRIEYGARQVMKENIKSQFDRFNDKYKAEDSSPEEEALRAQPPAPSHGKFEKRNEPWAAHFR